MPHAVLRRSLTTETRVQFQASPCGIFGAQSPSFLHYQYYSTSPPYTFIHLWPTLCNPSNLQHRSITHTVSVLKLLTSSTLSTRFFGLQKHVPQLRSNNRVNVIKPQPLGTSEHTGFTTYIQTFQSCGPMWLQGPLRTISDPATRFSAYSNIKFKVWWQNPTTFSY
jgi:hypothetical protein